MKKFAFTLAEVLIALGVVGVVASMTLPSVVRHFEDKATVNKLKKAYSTLSKAHEQLKFDDECNPRYWDLGGSGNSNGAKKVLNCYSKYIKKLKICNKGKGCFPEGIKYKSLDGTNNILLDNDTTLAKGILNDGTLMFVWVDNRYCNNENQFCATIAFDINGFRNPNRWGVDTFEFIVYPQKITPATNGDPGVSSSRCNPNQKNKHNGKSCTQWVLLYENLDYKYCKDLSFSGKHSCKE